MSDEQPTTRERLLTLALDTHRPYSVLAKAAFRKGFSAGYDGALEAHNPYRSGASTEERWDGLHLISVERQRHQAKYDAAHDDKHDNGQLAFSAAELALATIDGDILASPQFERDHCGSVKKYDGNRIQQLVIAGALIAAEIDRLERLGSSEAEYHRQWGAQQVNNMAPEDG